MRVVEIALVTKLKANAPLAALVSTRIYRSPAPSAAVEPFVVFQKQSGRNLYLMGHRYRRPLLYQIKAVDRSQSAEKANQIDEAIDAALTLQPLTLSSGQTLIVRRETDVSYSEETNGVIYQHAGADYLIEVTE